MAKAKSVDVKKVQTLVSDFSKLYNLELQDNKAKESKEDIERSLIYGIKEELDKYEH